MPFVYPRNDLDRPEKLLSLLGSFWQEIYEGRDLVRQLVKARGELTQYNMEVLEEAILSFNRQQVPFWSRRPWYGWTIKQSEKQEIYPHFDDEGLVFNLSGVIYDGPLPGLSAWASPPGLVAVSLITDRLADSRLVMVSGVDFTLEGGLLTFREDPFLKTSLVSKPVFEDDEIVDNEITLWLFRPQFDRKNLYNTWGHLLDLNLPGSETARQLINAFLDAVTGGTAAQDLYRILSLCTGLPLVRELQETVEEVTADAYQNHVVTDQHVYSFSLTASPEVGTGDIVYQGQALSNSLRFVELNRGEIPGDILGLSLGKGFLLGHFQEEVFFPNKEVPLEITQDEDGLTRVEFSLGGEPSDLTKFWDEVHDRGKESGKTLAQYMDVRSNPSSEPTAPYLPATINPLQFLVENLLRYNVCLAIINVLAIPESAPGLAPLGLLEKIIPPHTALIVIITYEVTGNPLSLNVVPSDSTAGGSSSVELFAAAEKQYQGVPLGLMSSRVSVRPLDVNC